MIRPTTRPTAAEAPQPANGTVRPGHGRRRETVLESLLADVFHGRVRAGQHLVTQELAVRFGVSHTPVREALIALGGLGILDLVPNRGAIVRRLTRQDVREICQVRKALECEATRSACGQIDPAELDDIARTLRKLESASRRVGARSVAAAREVDSRLHDLIARSCGNRFLASELNRLKLLFRAIRDVSWDQVSRSSAPRVQEEAREHLAIVEALRQERRADAARAMARHIRSGVKYWSRGLPDR